MFFQLWANLLAYIRYFHIRYNSKFKLKTRSTDVLLGIRTQRYLMVGIDESTEVSSVSCLKYFYFDLSRYVWLNLLLISEA